jgi:hypothetical protein
MRGEAWLLFPAEPLELIPQTWPLIVRHYGTEHKQNRYEILAQLQLNDS